MNAYEQLVNIRGQLVDMGAHPKTLQVVDTFIMAMDSQRDSNNSIALVQMVRHLSRAKEVINSAEAENDILGLLGELEDRRSNEDASRPAYEDTDRHPKSHNFYKNNKKK